MHKRIQSIYRKHNTSENAKRKKKEQNRPVQPIPPKESDKTDIQQTSTKEQKIVKIL